MRLRYPRPGSPAGIVLHLLYGLVVVYVYGLMFGAWKLP
jgi:hypothetical protein